VSIRQQIPLLEALADIDDKLRQVEEELALRRGGLQALRTEVEGLEKKMSTTRDSIATMEKTRNDLQIEVRQMNSQIEKSREKLGRSRNERESVAATRELEELRKLLRDREDEVTKIEQLIDRARTSVTEAETRHGQLKKELEGDADGVAQVLSEREKERADLVGQREAAQKAIPPVLYRKYETIRGRRPRAIASTHNGTCNRCHIAVPPMMFQKMLRQEEFEQCPNCKRILYYTPAPSREPSGSNET
jgi:predicted  nucleic acid-binding Zn-ribbon protein